MLQVLSSASDCTKSSDIKTSRYLCIHCKKLVSLKEKSDQNKKYFYHPDYKSNCLDDDKEQQYAIREFEPIKVRTWDNSTVDAIGNVLWSVIIAIGLVFWLNK